MVALATLVPAGGWPRAATHLRPRRLARPLLLTATIVALTYVPTRVFMPAPCGGSPVVTPGSAVGQVPAVPVSADADQAEASGGAVGLAARKVRPSERSGTHSSYATGPSVLGLLGAFPLLSLMTSGRKSKVQLAASNSDESRIQRAASGSGAEMLEEDIGAETRNVVIPVLGGIAGWIALMYAIQHAIIAVPFLTAAQAVYFPIVATFIAGYVVIVLEEQTEINKAATSLVLGVLVWAFVGTGLDLTPAQFSTDVKEVLEDVSEVVFFLLGALTIVEIMDAHKGFDLITKLINAASKRDLLVVLGVLTFVLSSVLNNLTVVIVMISLLQKLVKDQEFRMKLGGIVVIASNAGGAWTPIGDITTTMMYLGGQVTTVPLLTNLVVPSIMCVVGTLGYEYISNSKEVGYDEPYVKPTTDEVGDTRPPEGQALVFWGGLIGMVSVPVFTAFTQCPPWSGMMLVLGLLGIITSLLHEPGDDRYNLKGALTRVEVPDTLFFLGILFAVGGLEKIGLLKEFAKELGSLVPNDALVAIVLGLASAVVDNVPLVAASQGMYDLKAHPANDALWNLITYCAATGGSILVIGSAAGVAFMGMEQEVSFGWYVKKIAPAATVGYFVGVATLLLQQSLGLAIQ